MSNDLSVAPSDVFAVQHNPLELSDELTLTRRDWGANRHL